MKQILTAQILTLFNSKNPLSNKYADVIYKHFCKDIDNLFELSVGIPVFYLDSDATKIRYRLSCAKRTIVILLVDEEMFFNDEWKKIINDLLVIENPDIKIIPIGLIENAHNIVEKSNHINFLKITDASESTYQLVFVIAYQILEWITTTEEKKVEILMFLSHEKKLGTKYAKRIKDNISFVNLRTFLDENNIEPGKDFEVVIEKHLSDSSVVVIILTDTYSSREWCVKEVIMAKKNHKTVVLIDFLDDGEMRSFPYIGNVKTIKFNENINHLKLYSEIMKETLRQEFFEYDIQTSLQPYEYLKDSDKIFKQAPELFSVLHLDEKIKNVIYPDPPIGFSEINLLELAKRKIKYVTKSQYILMKEASYKRSKMVNIGLSISETQEIEDSRDLKFKFVETVIELTRYLIIGNMNIHYAGDVTYSGIVNISELIFDFSKGYNYLLQENTTRAWNWVLESKFNSAYKKKMSTYAPNIEVKIVKDYKNENQETYEKSNLSNLRLTMLTHTDVQIFVGGKTKLYRGYIPGVLEELVICLNSNKPIFIIGGFGGISKILVDAIMDKIDQNRFKALVSWNEGLISEHNKEFKQSIVFEEFYEKMKTMDFNNGLTMDENIELFETIDIDVIRTLVLKGLMSIKLK